MKIRALLASLALISALAGTAGAYVLDEDGNGHPLYWRDASLPVRYMLVSGNNPAGSAGENAIHNAFATWSGASTNVQYQFGGYLASGTQRYDNKNVIYWVYGGWSWDASLAAVTFRYYSTSDGHLLDADVVFNGERYAWSIGGAGYDIENSATHEVGHFSGLGHSGDSEATMYSRTLAGETKKRSLSGDDLAGLDALYGGTQVASSGDSGSGGVVSQSEGAVNGGGGGGGCAIGGKPGDPAELLWVGALLLGLLVRRAIRQPVR